MTRKMQSNSLVKVTFLVLSAMIVYLGTMGGDLQAAKPDDMNSMPPAKNLRYLCEDGKSFTLEIDTKEDCVILSLDGKPIKLPRVTSGSGARFSNGRTTVWLKGNEAVIEMDGKIVIKNCRILE
jgi:membrane-bound inhibitor of C-type lysozyme